MKIVWSPLALERVEDTARYIAEDSPDAAVRWVKDLFSAVERLTPERWLVERKIRNAPSCSPAVAAA